MVNLSLNWASISGLLLMALWVPALVVSLRRFDLLMDRDQPSASLQGLRLALFLITLAGRCIALPLVGSILFFSRLAVGSDPPIRTEPACLGHHR